MKGVIRLANGVGTKQILIHCLAWTLYMGYELLYIYVMTGPLKNPLSYAVNYALNIGLFYFNAHVLLPYFIEKLNWRWYSVWIMILLEILIYIAVKYPANLLVFGMDIRLKTYDDFYTYSVANALRSFHYIGFSTAYYLAVLNFKRVQKINDLENQRLRQQKEILQSRNAYLQAQVNPHLLFNTLNFMYNASARVSEKLARAVMTLSDLMRYALTSIDDDDKVQLSNEIDHINNFIALNQLRYEEKLNVSFEQQGSPEEQRIIPLALITLVENVFKYGDLLDHTNPAKIRLIITPGKLSLDISNKKRANRRLQGHGTGIANLKERLDIYYPERYSLSVKETEEIYTLQLHLTLND